MSRKKTKRRVYTTAPGFNPVQYAIEGAAPLPADSLAKLRLLDLGSLDSFARGCASMQDLTNLMVALNCSELLAREGVGPEALPICDAAEQVLTAANDRRIATGAIGTDEAGIDALRELCAIYDVQRQCITRSRYEKLLKRVEAIMRSGSPRAVTLQQTPSSPGPSPA